MDGEVGEVRGDAKGGHVDRWKLRGGRRIEIGLGWMDGYAVNCRQRPRMSGMDRWTRSSRVNVKEMQWLGGMDRRTQSTVDKGQQ